MKDIILLIGLWNVITFAMMGIDKYKAVRDKRRISEQTLLTAAFLFGSIGSILGALVFHHKTRKIKFQILFPISLFINILMFVGILKLMGYIVLA